MSTVTMVCTQPRKNNISLYFGFVLALGALTYFLVQYLSSPTTHLTRKLSEWHSESRVFVEIRSSTARPMTDREKLSEIANILGVHGNIEEEEYGRMLIEIIYLAEDQRKRGTRAKDAVEKIHDMIIHHAKTYKEMERLLEDMDVLDNLQPKLDPGKELSVYPFKRDPTFTPSKCPNGFQRRSEVSRWFRDRYIADVKVLLDTSDVKDGRFLDLNIFKLPFGYKTESKETVQSILRHTDNVELYRGRRKPCVRCAVVGCGGILNGSRKGDEIDSHDYVFRLNHAEIGPRHAPDVGNRTSFYIFFPESIDNRFLLNQVRILVFSIPLVYMFICINSLHRKLRNPQNVTSHNLRIVHPDFVRYAFVNYLNATSSRPTTGALTVFIAMHVCDDVTLYGFGYDKRFSLHYYDKKFVNHTQWKTGSHDVDNERVLWSKLHQENVVTWYQRNTA
ncbi:PREDICTED: alpha-N-acetylgalactosaminide alpha-2,6-sialyltransferase 2-like [Branchiostoma belcheri]|uniref:alpha-N-acetylgalactosaminide alpha-2,6-sialyltransferase n=1 Tax=Branchiostoma belcheri TaxID=7741 RepID=A0A6P4YFX0_BRABE|nr:PREDICTED: alpha-N-acetylgalactosaminide alpha-2,6-sialyltransferase 2-like [Branchiostoma belcheri]